MVQFWINSLTRYYLTSQRFIQSYRLLSVRSKAIPLSRIQATQESQTAMERLFGIGHVVIESAGESSASRIRARAIKHPYALAESLQSEIRSSEQ
ncbi:PH domain-containing protein [Halolamina litorea]